MKPMRIASAFALLSIFGTPALSAEPLQPIGKWTVDFGDAHCIAMRSYGTPDKPITLAFKPSPIGDVMQLSVVYANRSLVTDQYEGTLTIDRSPPFWVSVLGYAGKAGRNRVNLINLPLSTYQPIRNARSVRVRTSRQVDAAFALSQMEPVAHALDRCVAGLRKAWHIDDAGTGLRQPAEEKVPLRKYFSTEDYPRVAVRADASGTVAMVILIDETGKVASCMVTETSGYASLDAQSCAIVAVRAKFNPALGADGKPTNSGATFRIRWQMRA